MKQERREWVSGSSLAGKCTTDKTVSTSFLLSNIISGCCSTYESYLANHIKNVQANNWAPINITFNLGGEDKFHLKVSQNISTLCLAWSIIFIAQNLHPLSGKEIALSKKKRLQREKKEILQLSLQKDFTLPLGYWDFASLLDNNRP